MHSVNPSIEKEEKNYYYLMAFLRRVLRPCARKPLKVFILAGQSNMEGRASIETFDYSVTIPATAPCSR